MSTTLPLLEPCDTRAAFWWRGAALGREEFLGHVQRVARRLGKGRYAVNLCEDRYLFLVAFAAVLISGKTNLLPPNRAPQTVQDTAAAYPDSQILADAEIESAIVEQDFADHDFPGIPVDQIAVVVFTSGSTGRSRAHTKRWGDLVQGARCADRRFGFGRAGTTIVATVPAQHMYGLETSIMVPLACGVGVHGGRPFYAEDIRATLASIPAPRVLITTPIHLRVCVESALEWPPVEFIISATAPLTETLAFDAEQALSAPVLEIYGCTEAGSLASRRRLDGEVWETYDGMSVNEANSASFVHAPQLPEPVPLNDLVVVHDPTHFELRGRPADMVNVAGKRASLGDLTLKLSDIRGVHDAVFVAPDDEGDSTSRLVALVVAPGLSGADIATALATRIDPAFMPRPLYKVDRLPRDAVGKLPRAEVLALVRQLKAGT